MAKTKFELILELFQDYLDCTKEVCVVKSNLHGYVLLTSPLDDIIFESYICRTPLELYNRLLNEWETEICFQMTKKNGEENFIELYQSLSLSQKNSIEQRKEYYREKSEKILNSAC